MNSIRINTLSTVAASAEDNSNTAIDSFESETGWTFGDAVDMAVESRRDDRLFGNRRKTRATSRKPAAAKVSLEESIGWGPGALVDFLAENRRDERLFGKTPLYV